MAREGRLKLNLGAGPHLLDGFVNLGPPDWRFENGLDYDDDAVEAITASHSFMYLPLAMWTPFLQVCFRVLEPGGIIRVTEDNTEDPASERYGGWHDAATLTGPVMAREHLKAAGFRVRKHAADTTGFRDRSLCQAWHGQPPKVFFVEGRKP